eukprot:10257064-Lingulodinium_polyedra.AAC.1
MTQPPTRANGCPPLDGLKALSVKTTAGGGVGDAAQEPRPRAPQEGRGPTRRLRQGLRERAD